MWWRESASQTVVPAVAGRPPFSRWGAFATMAAQALLPAACHTSATRVKIPQLVAAGKELSVPLQGPDKVLDILSEAFKTKAEMFPPRLLGSVFGDMPWVLPDLWECRHTAIHGRKGTGKSMLLRYLSLPVQIRLADEHDQESRHVRCWGQYVSLAKSSLPQCRDTSAHNRDYERIFGHWFNLRMADAFLDGLDECQRAGGNWFSPDETPMLKSFGDAVGVPEVSNAASLAEGRKAVRKLTGSVTEFVTSLETAADVSLETYKRQSGYTGEFHTPEMFLTHLCEVLDTERLEGEILPVFVLLDQWDSLLAPQREVLFPLFGSRSPQWWYMKVGSVRPYDADLPPVPWDELAVLNVEEDADGPGYAKLCRDALGSRVELMRKRLLEAGVGEHILGLLRKPDDLFPPYSATDQYRDWSQRTGGRDNPTLFDVPCDAETQAHLALLRAGVSPLYSGVTTMIRLSSGFLRVFLELAHRVLKLALSEGPTSVGGGHVPHDWQDRAVRLECKELLDQKLKADVASLCPHDTGLPDKVQTWVRNLSRRFRNSLEAGSAEPMLHRIAIHSADDARERERAEKLASVLVATGVLTHESRRDGTTDGSAYRVSRAHAPNTELPVSYSPRPLPLSANQFVGLQEPVRSRPSRAEDPALLSVLSAAFFATAFREGEWQDAVRQTLKESIFTQCNLEYHDGEAPHESSPEIGRKVREMIRRMDLLLFDITDENPNVCFEYGMGVARNRPCYRLLNTAIPQAKERQKQSRVFPVQYEAYAWPKSQTKARFGGTPFDSLCQAVQRLVQAYQKNTRKDANPLDQKSPTDYTRVPGQVYTHVWTAGRISTWEADMHRAIRELDLIPAVVPSVSRGMTLQKHLEAAARCAKCIVDTSVCDSLACAVLGYVFMRDQDVLVVYDNQTDGVITNWIAEDAYRGYSSKEELLHIVREFLQA